MVQKTDTQGPVVFIKHGIIDDQFRTFLSALIDTRKLKPSYEMIIDSLDTLCLTPEFTTDDGHFVRFFEACSNIEGKKDPDYKVDRVIKMSKVTRYNRIKEMVAKGLLEEFMDSDLRSEYYSGRGQSNISIFTLTKPTKRSVGPSRPTETPLHKTSEYKEARKAEAEEASQMDKGYYLSSITKLGSMEILATWFNDCIRADDSIVTDRIRKEKSIPATEDNKPAGKLVIETVCSSDSDIMIGSDMVLLNYFYSAIREKLGADPSNITLPFQNLFRFDKVEILKDHGKPDSGGSRAALDTQVKRLTGTTFNLEADSNALWLIKKLGLVDGHGKPYPKAPVNLLIQRGEQIDVHSEDHNSLLQTRGSRRYLDLALPTFLADQVNSAIEQAISQNQSTVNIMPMYGRSLTLLQNGDSRGLVWLLVDFLSKRLPRPGLIFGELELPKFMHMLNASIKGERDTLTITRILLQTLSDARYLLHAEEWHVNARKAPRTRCLYAMIENRFLIRVKNITPGYSLKTRLSNIVYDFKTLRLTSEQASKCQERNLTISKDGANQEDFAFAKFAESLFGQAGATRKAYEDRD